MSEGATQAFQLRLPVAVHRELKRLAERERSTMNHEIYTAVRAHLDADKQRRTKR